jgi:hypothetical protein
MTERFKSLVIDYKDGVYYVENGEHAPASRQLVETARRVSIGGDVHVTQQGGTQTVRANTGELAVRKTESGLEITPVHGGGFGFHF